MSKTKTTKKAPNKSKPTKAAKKPAPKTKKAAQAPAEVEVQAGACPKGGDHEWKTEDGQTFCANCFEPSDGVAKATEASAEPGAATAEQPVTEPAVAEAPTAEQPAAIEPEAAAAATEQPASEQPAADQRVAEAGGKKRKAKKASEPKADGKLSAIDAAAKVLTEAGKLLTSKEMITAMAEKGYWTSPGGKTPHATLYSAILREISVKGAEARFQKTERGKFAVRGA